MQVSVDIRIRHDDLFVLWSSPRDIIYLPECPTSGLHTETN
jgi:hypothetical protein